VGRRSNRHRRRREPPREKGGRTSHRSLGREQFDCQSSGQAPGLPPPGRPDTGACATPNCAEELVLEEGGIREHACNLLDGGETAFQKRKRKYNI